MRGPGKTFASYLLVLGLFAAPWLAAATHAIPINSVYARGDTRLLTWILWWVAHSLVENPAGILDAPINYPAPAQITGSEHFAALQLIFLPIYQATANPVLGINAVLFLSYPLAALAMNRLLLAYGFAPLVAWVIGLAFALGALQVPAHVHLLHTLALYLPAVALTLHHVRRRPDARMGAVLALLLLVAFFSAYYTAAIVLPVLVVCAVAELLRPLPGRRRFAIVVALAVLVGMTALLLASLPYLSRGAMLAAGEELQNRLRQVTLASSAYLTFAAPQIFGVVALVLGVAGLCGLASRRWRPVAALGLALVASSVALVFGAGLALLSLLPDCKLADLMAVPLSFFRVVIRYVPIAGFGLALLGAVALQRVSELLPRRATLALATVLVAALALDRGRLLFRQPLETSSALTAEAPVYREVAEVVAREGGGPLLEMPVSSFGYSLQPEAMMGEMQHGQPLIVGHTGYLPPHRRVVDETVARLPDDHALQELVDMTRLRWLLVRPTAYWGNDAARTAFVDAIVRADGVRALREIDGWTLLAVERTPVHGGRFDAIASGPTANRSRVEHPFAPRTETASVPAERREHWAY